MDEIISCRSSGCRRTRGVALLMVLIIVLAVTVIATGFIARADVELASGENMLARTQLDHLADSALEHARGLLLCPQDVSGTYWTGEQGLQLIDGSPDYYDVAVTRDATDTIDYCTYVITCEAYRLKNAQKVGRFGLSAVLRMDPCIAFWTRGDTTFRQNWVLHGDMRTEGRLVNQATAPLDGDVFATQLIGACVGQVRGSGDVPLIWPPITAGHVNPSYTRTDLTGTLSGNPGSARIWRRVGSLVLGANSTVSGMLLVTENLTVAGSGSRITAAKNLPALYVGGDLVLEDADGLTVEGLAVVTGNLRIRATASNVKFLGGLCLGGAINETTADASGYGNQALVHGNPLWTSENLGGALKLDGVDDYVDCGNNAIFDVTSAVTVAAWVKTERAGAVVREPLVTKGAHTYALAINGNRIEFAIYSDAAATWMVAEAPLDGAFNNGAWRHLAGTFDGINVKLYLDGALQSTAAYAGVIASRPADRILIGSDCEGLSQFYQGGIDDVRIYDHALTENLIPHVMAGNLTVNLIGQWRLDGPGSHVTILADPVRTAIVAWPDGIYNTAVYWSPAGDAFFRRIARYVP